MKAKAPYKRGTKLLLACARGHKTEVTYVKWWGIQRSALIVVRMEDGTERTVHVNDVQIAAQK